KRIESGRLVPTIVLARKLENALSIKLLEPVVEAAQARLPSPAKIKELTLGDVVSLKKREK
ncbi:MAG: TIGR00270 family protein, partial [Sulfolobales archaeon]